MQDYRNYTKFLDCFLDEAQIKWLHPLSLHSVQGGDFSAKPKCRAGPHTGQRLEARETRTMDHFALQLAEPKILGDRNAKLLQL